MPEVNYLWDPIEDNAIAEFDEGGSAIAEYSTEPELYGNVISQRRDGESNCFYSDGLGSTTEVTNAVGDVIATRANDAFGETTETLGGLVFPYQFVGQKGYYRDNESAKYYVRTRFYEAVVCRWMSLDPAGMFDSVNRYSYSHNSVNRVDPSGFACKVINSTQNFRNGVLDDFDLDAMVGKPYTTAFTIFADELRMKYMGDFPISKINVPSPIDVTGPKLLSNPVTISIPIAGVYNIAYWPFFTQFRVCEDKPGDCELAVYETWKEEEHELPDPDKEGWFDVTDPKKKVRHAAFARGVPPMFPIEKANMMSFEPKNAIDSCCTRERIILHADIPNVQANLKVIPDVIRKAFVSARRATIYQENIIFEKGGAVPLTSNNIEFRIGVDTNGKLIANP